MRFTVKQAGEEAGMAHAQQIVLRNEVVFALVELGRKMWLENPLVIYTVASSGRKRILKTKGRSPNWLPGGWRLSSRWLLILKSLLA